MATSTWFAVRENKQRVIAEQREVEALAARESAALEREVAVKERDRVSALNATIEKKTEQQRRMLYVSDMQRMQSAWNSHNFRPLQALLNAHRPEPGCWQLVLLTSSVTVNKLSSMRLWPAIWGMER